MAVLKIDELRIELLKVADKAPGGSHFEAARRCSITPDGEMRIRKGTRCKEDTKENHAKLEKLIEVYKILGKKEVA